MHHSLGIIHNRGIKLDPNLNKLTKTTATVYKWVVFSGFFVFFQYDR